MFRMKEVCSLLSSPHLPSYSSSPSGYLLLEISLQLLSFPQYLVVYFFQMEKRKRKCCRRGFVSKDRQIFNSTVSLIPWHYSTNNLTYPTPISFSGPTTTWNAQKRGSLDRIRDLYRTALNPSQHDSLSHVLLQAHTLCTLSPQGARLLWPWLSGTMHSMSCPVSIELK